MALRYHLPSRLTGASTETQPGWVLVKYGLLAEQTCHDSSGRGLDCLERQIKPLLADQAEGAAPDLLRTNLVKELMPRPGQFAGHALARAVYRAAACAVNQAGLNEHVDVVGNQLGVIAVGADGKLTHPAD